MVKKKSFGLPFNGDYEQREKAKINNSIYSENNTYLLNESLNMQIIDMLILKELCGNYKFITENNDLLRLENVFWFNLYFHGRVGIIKIDERFAVVEISSVWNNVFGEVEKASVKFAKILFQHNNNVNDSEIFEVNGDEIVIFNLDNSFMTYWMRYGWLSKELVSQFNQYKLSFQLQNKNLVLYSNTKSSKLVEDIVEQIMNPEKPIIILKNPKFEGDIKEDATLGLEKEFKMEEVDSKQHLIPIEEIIKFWRFGKDLLGMNSNTAVKKERLVTSEIEDAEVNTSLIQEVELRNLKFGCKELKEKFNLQIDIIKTVDDYDLHSKNGDKSNNDYEESEVTENE